MEDRESSHAEAQRRGECGEEEEILERCFLPIRETPPPRMTVVEKCFKSF